MKTISRKVTIGRRKVEEEGEIGEGETSSVIAVIAAVTLIGGKIAEDVEDEGQIPPTAVTTIAKKNLPPLMTILNSNLPPLTTLLRKDKKGDEETILLLLHLQMMIITGRS